jgi:hypothetical protein
MTLPISTVVAIAAAVLAYLSVVYFIDRSLDGPSRVPFRYAALLVSVAAFFIGVGGISLGPLQWKGLIGIGAMDHTRGADISKALIAIAAAAAVFYEQHRVGMRRPIAERWKRFVGIGLALAAVTAYFDGFYVGFPRFYHRHDQYHYYLGSKYFAELGYDRLYKCSTVALDEMGTVTYQDEDHIGAEWAKTRPGKPLLKLDLTKEVRHPDWKIRNLGGDNLLMTVQEILDHPEICKAHFAPQRWEQYKTDVLYFRLASDKKYWEGFHHDHGYNPPPVWTMGGHYVASLYPAGKVFSLPILGDVVFLQAIGFIDEILLAMMFAGIVWAWGWRVAAVSAIFWGCQASAPILWTYGAFLRQDWLFWLVMAAAFARKRFFWLSGAAMVYAGLLRIFPGLVVVGWLVVLGFQLYRHKKPTTAQWKMLGGGVLAAAVLIPMSMSVAGKDSYSEFYRHTLKVHDTTPLTNHMGLRVLLSQAIPFEVAVHKGPIDFEIGTGIKYGRMKYTKDDKLVDPFDLWKSMRNDRYKKYKVAGYAMIALTLGFLVLVLRRVKSMWIAQCLAQVFIILLSQLTSYYYAFMILMGPLTKANRQLEAPLFGFAALSQFVYIIFYWNDDKYWMLTAISLVFCWAIMYVFLPRADRERVEAFVNRFRKPSSAA